MHHTQIPSLIAMPGGSSATVAGPLCLDIRFDASTLLLGLSCADTGDRVCASFPSVIGFRQLENRELTGFRLAAGDVPVWLWRVEGGGWRTESGMQDGLLENAHSVLHEYLILAGEEGVNVLCCGTPQVYLARS